MLGFLRRRPAHARGGLGAAVTAIPSAPVAVPVAAVRAFEADLPVVPPAPEAPVGPRVELGFRDGTSTLLDPGSAEAQALEELAELLAHRV